MKTAEVTPRISLQFTSVPRFSLAPANCDQNTLLAVNRRVASSNLARGANSLFNQLVRDCSFSVFGDRSKNVVSVLGFSRSEPTRTAQKANVSCESALCKCPTLRFGSEWSGIFSTD